jgi:hypothetical protein
MSVTQPRMSKYISHTSEKGSVLLCINFTLRSLTLQTWGMGGGKCPGSAYPWYPRPVTQVNELHQASVSVSTKVGWQESYGPGS